MEVKYMACTISKGLAYIITLYTYNLVGFFWSRMQQDWSIFSIWKWIVFYYGFSLKWLGHMFWFRNNFGGYRPVFLRNVQKNFLNIFSKQSVISACYKKIYPVLVIVFLLEIWKVFSSCRNFKLSLFTNIVKSCKVS